MAFRFSEKSLNKLKGVHPDLIRVAKRAIEITKVDFGVTCGMRSVKEQERLVADGASQTMNSKHLPQHDKYSHAIDVLAYIGSRHSWELNLYDEIADAMRQAAIELDVQIRWGAAWHIDDIRTFDGTMEEAMMEYIDLRRSQGKRPFLDGPHFELRGY